MHISIGKKQPSSCPLTVGDIVGYPLLDPLRYTGIVTSIEDVFVHITWLRVPLHSAYVIGEQYSIPLHEITMGVWTLLHRGIVP